MAPTKPMTAASPRMEKLTCRLLAPSARNKASSRTRWATSIWNVLAMMNAPTKTAMNPKISKIVFRNPRFCWI